ncbi:hypothetical protein BLGI_798 [Brevibacillus laterosporus GI-9]|nr:hypothetical protein BLGI_798 [Brevibacillus laterosporus GI-9]
MQRIAFLVAFSYNQLTIVPYEEEKACSQLTSKSEHAFSYRDYFIFRTNRNDT